jgi:hypothetical protein
VGIFKILKEKKSLLFSNNEFFATGHLMKCTIVIGAPWQCKLCNIDPQEMGHFLPQVYLVITRTGSPLSIFGTIYLEPMKTQLEVGSLATLLKARESVQI